MDYFVRREPSVLPDFEEAYWGTVVDPDGKVRDRHAERDQHVGDFHKEIDHLNALPGGRLVDVGCGLGFLLSALDDTKWERHGVELSAYAAEHASRWAAVHVGDLEGASYEDDFFDAVVMSHVIEHVPDPFSLVKEIWRVMKPGGTLILCTPDFDSGAARHFGEQYRLFHDKSHITLFSSESMHRFLRDHGFLIDHVDYPFFETRYFTKENLLRLFDTSKISPPFYGNFMSFYCRKPLHPEPFRELSELAGFLTNNAEQLSEQLEGAGELVSDVVSENGKVFVRGGSEARWLAESLSKSGITASFLEEASGPSAGGPSPEDVLIVVSSTSSPASMQVAVNARTIGIGDVPDEGWNALVGPIPGASSELVTALGGLLAKRVRSGT